ncbi:MAG TPA: sigma-70 family RNA polymerase sigma factor [Xanthobacteraceae bacterium]|jgi:RNA polymerase sigma-70 factor (ECF subfamily)|nr:sigma-70 family RNA polymerase sigma factor [Xanthobacteraceae bacterium]
MAFEGDRGDRDKAQRFRLAALPYLDDVYTLARYLLRNPSDAEDAAQECYLRAFRHFETFRGGPIKPWLLAILRNVCRAEYARRAAFGAMVTESLDEAEHRIEGLWSEAEATPEARALSQLDDETVRRLMAELPDQFREALVLREISDLSYREIADVIGVPVGTVMSRLARARALLREAWMAEEKRSCP